MSVGGCTVTFLMHRPNHCTLDSHVLLNFGSKSTDIMLVTHNYNKCTPLPNKFQANNIKLSTLTYSHRTTAYFSNKDDWHLLRGWHFTLRTRWFTSDSFSSDTFSGVRRSAFFRRQSRGWMAALGASAPPWLGTKCSSHHELATTSHTPL